MKRFLSFSLLAVVLAMLVAPAVQAGDRHEIIVRGVITNVGDAGFVLRIGSGDDARLVHVRIGDHTRITLNGEPAELSDLQPRDRAVVKGVLRVRDGRHVILAARVNAFGRRE